MRKLRFALAAVVVAVLALPASPAWAEGVTVRNVDTRDYPVVRLDVLVNGDAPRTTDFALRENGKIVSDIEVRPLSQTSKPVGTVLVIDTSGSMQSRGAIDQAKAAARSFIAAKNPNDWIALVSFSSQALIRSDFTQDAGALEAAVDSLAASGETALYDGVVMGARLFEKRPDLQPNVVLLSDGADTVSAGTEQQAVSALTTVHAAVYAVGIGSDEFDPARLEGFISAAGGSLTTSTNPADLTKQFASIRRAIDNQYEVVYTSTGQGGSLSLDLSVGSLATKIETRAGTVGAAAAAEPVIVKNSDGGIFGGTTGKLIILLLVMTTAGLLAWALLLIFSRQGQSIEGRLGGYTQSYGVQDSGTEAHGHAESSFVQRAVDLTSKVAEKGGFLQKVEAMLEQANLPLRPAEALFFYISGVALVGLLVLLTAPRLPVGVMFAVLVILAPLFVVKIMRKQRIKAFEAQLPDTLNLLAGSLRAGYSFMQGVEAVAQETSEPMARELRRVIAESRLGRPVEEAMADVAERMESRDFDWSVMAIRIQREVGGNLAELLQTVAETMVQRSRLRGEVKTLTAEGRLSAIIMGLLPIALGGFMFVASPDYISELFKSVTGWAMVIGSAIAGVAGFAWLQKIINIEV